MAVTEASRIAAAGIPLNLGGREVRVRFTMRSWALAEERFGSLESALEIMRRFLTDDPERRLKKPVAPTVALLWMALAHEGISEDEVYDLTDIHNLQIYQSALLKAVTEGTPTPAAGKADGEAASPGATTTTPSPSVTDAAMASSGV